MKIIYKFIMTGVFPAMRGEFGSGLNHFTTYGVLEPEFSEYYGITEDELNSLLKDFFNEDEIKIKEMKDAIKNWYNGYNSQNYIIYNLFSIFHCLSAIRNRAERPLQNIGERLDHLIF